MKMFAGGLALLLVLASPDLLVAKTKKVPLHPGVQAPVRAAGPYARFVPLPHSPNPEWDVYRNGRYVGSDPDPNVRLMLLKDNWSQYD